jgi:hypothetical protein
MGALAESVVAGHKATNDVKGQPGPKEPPIPTGQAVGKIRQHGRQRLL